MAKSGAEIWEEVSPILADARKALAFVPIADDREERERIIAAIDALIPNDLGDDGRRARWKDRVFQPPADVVEVALPLPSVGFRCAIVVEMLCGLLSIALDQDDFPEKLYAEVTLAKGDREALALIAGALSVGAPGDRPNPARVIAAVRSLLSLLEETERQRGELEHAVASMAT